MWLLRLRALGRVVLDDARRLLRITDWLVFLMPASLSVALLLNRSPNPAVDRWLGGLLIASLWLSLLWVAHLRGRDQRATAGSLQRLSRHLHSSQPFSDTLRADSAHAHSILEEVTTEVAQVLSQSERRWKTRARLSADWYWETDEALRVVWVSEDLQSHLKLGLRPDELLGRRHDEVPFYSPPEGGWERLHQLQAQRKNFRDVEIEVRRPGRSPVWMSLSGRPRLSADNRFMGYEGVGRDVTERRLSFKRLYESERRYAVIADLSADWYWETDASHRIAFMGPLAHELLGEAAARATGEPPWIAYADGASDEAWARHRDDLQAGRPFRGFEFRIRRAARGPLWVSISGLPRHNERGEFLGYHGVGRDITLRKRAEKILMTRNAQLERLVAERTGELEQTNRDLDAFSRQLAHELRTPIGHVVGLADLLRARAWERLSDEERSWLDLQGQSARAMSQTVTALLELARSNSLPMVREPVDLSALAHSVAAELPWLERRAPVSWLIEPGLSSDCSAALMRVVLMNLMANAAKFTRDIEQPEVRIGCSSDGGQRHFFVQDNGAGFDGRRGATLFQPFVRLHAQEQFQGTGLGLSIVRRIVERHGGQVQARGEPGKGACFEFTLASAETRAANGDAALEDGDAVGDHARPRLPSLPAPTQVAIAGESPDDGQRSVA
jgi:PAS domain S-box-containing protein